LFWSFFFQAEDGIRDLIVTGVQTCALPILTDYARSAPSGSTFGRGFNSLRLHFFLVPCAGSCHLPPAREPSRDREEEGRGANQYEHLRPDLGDRFLTPEDLREAVERPRVEGHEPDLLKKLRHDEARNHAPAKRGHDQHDERGERAKLSARLAGRG